MSKSSKPKQIVEHYKNPEDYTYTVVYTDGSTEKVPIELDHPKSLAEVYSNVGNDVSTEPEEDNTDIQEQITEIVLTLTKEFEEKVAHERALRAEAEKCAEDLRHQISGLRRELQGRDEQDRRYSGTSGVDVHGAIREYATNGWTK